MPLIALGFSRSALGYGKSLGRVLNPPVGTPSPLLARRSMTMGLGARIYSPEGELLRELERTKPTSQSLSAYVRSLLRQEVLRRKMAEATEQP